MEKTDWAEVRSRLKKAVDQGVKALKEGSQGARYAAGQTAHVLQLEMDIFGLKNRIVKLTTELGEAVYKSMKGGKLQMTADIGRIVGDLDTMKSSLKKKQSEVHRTHLTRPNGASKPRKKVH